MREFDYASPRELPAMLAPPSAARDGVRYLGGGTTLYDLMKLGIEQPRHVVDVTRCAELRGIDVDAHDGFVLGAGTTMAEAANHPLLQNELPVLTEVLAKAASQQIRNMATLGGNLLQRTRCPYFRGGPGYPCNKREPGSGCSALEGLDRGHAVLGGSDACIATYPGDLAVALVALDARLDVLSRRGERTLAVADLHRLPGATPHVETTLEPDELIVRIRVPRLPAGRASTFHKVRDRESYAFALAAAAVCLQVEQGRVADVRIALGGVATRPWRAHAAEVALRGRVFSRAAARAAAEAAFLDARPRRHNAFKVPLGIETVTDALMLARALA